MVDWRSRIRLSDEQIAEFCEKHHIVRMAVFGSVLREDFGPESDLDVLVEFDAEHVPGLAFMTMKFELERLTGRTVDFMTFSGVHPQLRGSVHESAVQVYAAA